MQVISPFFQRIIDNMKIKYYPVKQYHKNPWILDAELDVNLEMVIENNLRLSKDELSKNIKRFNGKIIGGDLFFKSYDDAKASLEWIYSIYIMNRLGD